MFQLDFDNPIKAHFIGIGGISMSGLAIILKERGFTVSGSDESQSPIIKRLLSMGIRIYEGNLASNLDDRPDVIIYTAAIHPDNPEFSFAKKLGIPMLTRAELLGQIMKNYPTAIGVSGTHGKTTVTSMMSHVLLNASLEPTICVGGMLPRIGGNIHVGSGDTFLTEACEYTNSFLSLYPTVELILNIEEDHLDFFKDLEDIRRSFRKYMELLPEDGILAINSSISNLDELTTGLPCKNIVTFGLDEAISDYSCRDLILNDAGCFTFTVSAPKRSVDGLRIGLNVPGMHNVSNALAVVAACDKMGISPKIIRDSLEEFSGAGRRFQKKGEFCGITIIDDYAHHPREISVTLKAAANYPHKKLWVIFQPHTYTRTKSFFLEFADALSAADEVILAKIYPARETDTLGMSSKKLADEISSKGTPATAFETFSEIESFIKAHCAPGDLLITMGAGDVFKIGDELLAKES